MPPWFFYLAQSSVLAYALLGGVFLAFSDFIMRSLARTSGSGGVEAMQTINREVFRYLFMTLFIGMAPVSLLIAGYAAFALSGPGTALIAMAGVVYLAACFLTTIVFNVPMNEALARMDPASDPAAAYWSGTYLPRWTFWNSVRAAACTLASVLAMTGLIMSLSAPAA